MDLEGKHKCSEKTSKRREPVAYTPVMGFRVHLSAFSASVTTKRRGAMKTKEKEELKALIHGHSLFFDRLVELIPARFYLPGDGSGDEQRVWFQGLSKQAKAAAKKETRENLKKARRQRLDPENANSTLDLLKKSIVHAKSCLSEGEEDEEEEKSPNVSLKTMVNPDGAGSVTYEELRERLHRRIQELRGNRNTRTISSSGVDRKPKNIKKLMNKNTQPKDENKRKELEVEKKASDVSTDLTFSQVKIDGKEVGKKGKKKRKTSREEELKSAKKLKKAMDDPMKGTTVSTKHSWRAAASRAAGEKVHDDPKLLKQSIKKDRRRKQKNAQKWKERIQTTEKSKASKQQARSENIAQRAHDKKMRRIAKREKKLMRPGFEGRKDGFINES